jgi:hypothetical protein
MNFFVKYNNFIVITLSGTNIDSKITNNEALIDTMDISKLNDTSLQNF